MALRREYSARVILTLMMSRSAGEMPLASIWAISSESGRANADMASKSNERLTLKVASVPRPSNKC